MFEFLESGVGVRNVGSIFEDKRPINDKNIIAIFVAIACHLLLFRAAGVDIYVRMEVSTASSFVSQSNFRAI